MPGNRPRVTRAARDRVEVQDERLSGFLITAVCIAGFREQLLRDRQRLALRLAADPIIDDGVDALLPRPFWKMLMNSSKSTAIEIACRSLRARSLKPPTDESRKLKAR